MENKFLLILLATSFTASFVLGNFGYPNPNINMSLINRQNQQPIMGAINNNNWLVPTNQLFSPNNGNNYGFFTSVNQQRQQQQNQSQPNQEGFGLVGFAKGKVKEGYKENLKEMGKSLFESEPQAQANMPISGAEQTFEGFSGLGEAGNMLGTLEEIAPFVEMAAI